MCRRLGDEAEAEAALRLAVERAPALADAHASLAQTLARRGRPTEAEAAFRAALARQPRHAVAHEGLGSTNAEALRLAREGGLGPLWVTAEQQSAGRGRRGRAWISPAGNLHASLLLTDPTATEHWPQLSFVAALAAHDAVVQVAADLKRLLKLSHIG